MTIGTPAIIILIIIGVIAVIGIIIVTLALIHKKREELNNKRIEESIDSSTRELASLFGTRHNIKEVTTSGSRVSITVFDPDLLNTNEIKNKFQDVLFTGNKVVFVVGEKAEEFASKLKINIK